MRNLVFATVVGKLTLLIVTLQKLSADGSGFAEHAVDFLNVSWERMALACRLLGNNLINNEGKNEIFDHLEKFWPSVKTPFVVELMSETENARLVGS